MADTSGYEQSSSDQYQPSSPTYDSKEVHNNGSHRDGNNSMDRNNYGQSHYPNDDSKKIFVGGLSWETTVKDLKEYFSKYGEVVDSVLKTDTVTGRSRGFGFVSFASKDSVEKVVRDPGPHSLHGKNIDPKRALAKGATDPIKKVFVGGLDPSITEEEVRDYFGKFGTIVELDLPFDAVKQQRRAFCFVTFDNEKAVELVVENHRHTVVSGKREVDVKKALPRQEQNRQQGGWGDRGRGRGGRGRDQNFSGGSGGGGWNNQNSGYDYGGNYNYQGGYDYNNSGYYGQGYSGGYDGNYDYNYYNQGWGGYGQNYGQGYDQSGSYDYNWYGNQSGGAGQASQGGEFSTSSDQSAYKAKAVRGASSTRGGSQYHPYQRQ